MRRQPWSDPCEREDAQRLGWAEFHRRWPERSQWSYEGFRRDKKQGGRTHYADEQVGQEQAIPPGVAFVPQATLSAVEVPLEAGARAAQARKLTIACGDTQFGDQGHLYECWQECCQCAVELAKAEQPAEVEIVHVGDLASGRGIYRNQELRNILPLAQPHVLWGCWELLNLMRDLTAAAPQAKVYGRNLQGNHDLAMGENLALIVPVIMSVLGVEWKFCGRQTLVNLAAEGAPPYVIQAEHGYGHSSYYPNSYSQIRGTWQDLLSKDRRYQGQQFIWRVVCGHTHWLNIGYALAEGRFLDTVGGFQRQDRLSLPPSGRPVGMIAYSHDGARVMIRAITPDQATLDRLEDDQELDVRNALTASQQLLKMHAALRVKGLVV